MISPRRLLVSAMLLTFAFPALQAQDAPTAHIDVFACQQRPQTKRSPILVSQSGARAYIEAAVRVIATAPDQSSGELAHKCRAVWTLHVAAPGENKFETIPAYSLTEKAFEANFSTDGSMYYGGSVIGWSQDGDLLLAYAQIGAYEDWFLPIPVVYSFTERKSWVVDLQPVFAKRTSKECDLHFDPLGFSQDGKVVLDISPFAYVEPQSCFSRSRWLLEFRTKSVTPATKATKASVEFKTTERETE